MVKVEDRRQGAHCKKGEGVEGSDRRQGSQCKRAKGIEGSAQGREGKKE